MPSPGKRAWIEVEQVGAVTVGRLARRELVEEAAITTMGQHLFRLVEELDCRQIVLDFGEVERLASGLLGKLIGLHKKLQAVGGRMVLCRIPPHLMEAFRTLHLHRLFGIYADEQEALQSFQA